MHAAPVLLSVVATVVLSKAEKNVLETHHKFTVQKVQRLHPRTPRDVPMELPMEGSTALKRAWIILQNLPHT